MSTSDVAELLQFFGYLFGLAVAILMVVAQFQLFGIHRQLQELVKLQRSSQQRSGPASPRS